MTRVNLRTSCFASGNAEERDVGAGVAEWRQTGTHRFVSTYLVVQQDQVKS